MMSESLRIPSKDEITFSLFLPPKIASAVRLYGDVTIFDASASFLSLPDRRDSEKAQTEFAEVILFNLISITKTVRRYLLCGSGGSW